MIFTCPICCEITAPENAVRRNPIPDLKKNWLRISTATEKKHRSELCTLYIREHLQQFKVIKANPPQELIRRDLRLTVDNPEDLAVCRVVYGAFKKLAPKIPITDVVRFLDAHPKLIEMVAPFTAAGYTTMYR